MSPFFSGERGGVSPLGELVHVWLADLRGFPPAGLRRPLAVRLCLSWRTRVQWTERMPSQYRYAGSNVDSPREMVAMTISTMTTVSGRPIEPLYTETDLRDFDPRTMLGLP